MYRDAIDVRRGPRLALIRGVARETLSLFPAGTLLLAAGASYCGLSGVVYGLLVLALLEGPTSRRSRAACWGAAAALAAKSAFEYHGGGWLVEGETLEGLLGVVFLPGSHCAGLAGGAAVAFLYAGSLGAASTHAARNARAAASGVTPPKARWAPRVVRPGVW